MSNKPETSADIERDLRDRADCAERHGDRETHNDGVATLLRSIADRIKAASKRELGNGAAMRATLRTLRQRFDNNVMAYQDRYFKFSGWHWHKKAAEAARWRDVFHELREACDAALSAPARNCDMYPIRKTAQIKFEESLPDIVKTEVRNYPFAAMDMFIDWLLANATEKACWAWEAQR